MAVAHGLPVREFLGRITSREFAELEAMESIDPVTDTRLEIMLAMGLAMFANAHRAEGRRPYKPEDFMPFQCKPEKTVAQRNAEIEAALGAWVSGNH